MAFIKANLLNSTGMPPGFADYVYVSNTDTKAIVLAPGYFHNLDDNQNLTKNDLIHVRGDQGIYTVKVSSVSSGIITTTLVVAATSYEEVTVANVILASETGKHFVLNNTTGFASTLPEPALDLEYWFHISFGAPITGNHRILTNNGDNIIEGSITSPDVSAPVVVAAAADTISFITTRAKHGDLAHVWCDGTTWYLDGHCFDQAGMTTQG